MKTKFISLIIFIGVLIILELYTYSGLKSYFNQAKQLKIFNIIFAVQLIFSVLATIWIIYEFSTFRHNRSLLANVLSGYLFSAFIFKLIFSSMLFLQDSGRVLFSAYEYIKSWIVNPEPSGLVSLPGRREFITTGSVFVAAVPFLSLLYGITVGKYKYTLNKVALKFSDLPKAFHGLKVIQISDIHAGSLDSVQSVEKAIELINDQEADLVLFTGDLVNMEKDEILPYIQSFARIRAKIGKFAVLGNHDYIGMYQSADKLQYLNSFIEIFDQMGFRLLLNESATIEKDGEKIYLAGVENWGRDRWFPKEGDLDLALQSVPDDSFIMLMSHDPTHWDEIVKTHPLKVHLTMSGHTHGMQFGIDIPGFQWSPVKYRYPQWKGLYHENERNLYVNIGFGFLGFPGRVGMWPEITLFELESEQIAKLS